MNLMKTQPPVQADRSRKRWVPRAWFAAGVIMAIGAVGIYIQGSRQPAGPDSGSVLIQVDSVGPKTYQRDVFRVGTFNIHGAKDAKGNPSMAGIARTIHHLDVVGLNEVHGDGPGSGPSDNQAGELGRLMQMPWLFAPTEKRWGSDDFGNGLLCSIPVNYWQRITLPGTEQSGYRNSLLAVMEVNGRPVRVMITHIDRSHDRIRQLSAVGQMFASLQEPAILMGDLNSDSSDATMRQLLSKPGVIDALGQLMGKDDPPGRIDWILVRGLKVREAGLVDEGASDHPMAWAELQLLPDRPAETRP